MEDSNQNMGSGKPIRKRTVPTADIDFGAVVKSVSAKWTANNWLTLKWLTSATFAADAASYNEVLKERLDAGSVKPQTAKAAVDLEKQMDDALSYVKGYIIEKYKKNSATSYYPAFGILYRGNRHILPTDREARIAALDLMIKSIETHGFQDKEFGTDFWTSMKAKLEAVVSQSTAIGGEISVAVGDKNVLKNNLKKGLNSIILSIKANYPDTFAQELRSWGFQKEKY